MDTRKRPQPKPLPVLKDKEVEQCAADGDDDDDSVEEEEEEEEERYGGVKKKKKKKKKVVSGGGGGSRKKQKGCGGSGGGGRCQAEKCAADLTDAKRYHRRHKVCELHAKASAVVVAGLRQRFCQQCSRFHELFLFDDTKRSCRTRLAGHNERRRKSSSESHGEGSGSPRLSLQLNESHRRRQADDADDRGNSLIAFPGNPTYKQFHIH